MRVLSLAGHRAVFGFSFLDFQTSGHLGHPAVLDVLYVLLRVNVLRHNVSIAHKGM